MIRGEEMHKSLGNFVTLEQAFEHWDPMIIRFFILLSHYRGPLDVTDEAVDAAAKGLERLRSTIRGVCRRLANAPDGEASGEVAALLEKARLGFDESMNDDFNTAGAIAALFDLSREVNAQLGSGRALSKGTLEAISGLYDRLVGDVLGIQLVDLDKDVQAGLSGQLIELLIETRAKLRQAKQWALADEVRDHLAAMGVQLQDGAQGTTWMLT